MTSEVEEQALTVYHFWWCKMSSRGTRYDEQFGQHLMGLFDSLKSRLPSQASEALKGANARVLADEEIVMDLKKP